MHRNMLVPALAILGLTSIPALAQPHPEGAVSYEEQLARVEDQLVYRAPIAGVENNAWFDYETDLAEARKELKKDLRGASDAEDNRDAWEEYRAELADARGDYAKEMAEKGYQVGDVRLVGPAR